MRYSKSKRKFYDSLQREIESHKDGFRDSGVICRDCGKAVPFKYRGEEANPESFHLGGCDDCFVQVAEGYTIKYHYNSAIENASMAGINLFWIFLIAKFIWDIPWVIAGALFATALVPGTAIINRTSRRETTPQQQAEDYLKGIDSEDEKIRKWIMYDRAEKAALERIRLKKASGIEEIDVMNGLRFEELLQSLFVKLGYLVQRTPASGDQGLDLILKRDGIKIGVQAKRYQPDQNVGNSAVQEVISGRLYYDCDEGWVVTNCMFTDPAKALAKKADIKLIDRTQLIKLLAKDDIS
ncbi:restriction endonuclease [Paenibacillus sp. FSL A5-0031]|uniref:restriction endonuclease n=1 Tax=Paenibacillus sp. FSL A5-0031 TaxID=1920420 RepID=UPI002116024F|nr:restriction endonuclease [Paenibacillus sp. FSL A5-0031]